MSLILGLALAFLLGTGLHFGAKLFTKDVNVLHLIRIEIPVIFLFSNHHIIFLTLETVELVGE